EAGGARGGPPAARRGAGRGGEGGGGGVGGAQKGGDERAHGVLVLVEDDELLLGGGEPVRIEATVEGLGPPSDPPPGEGIGAAAERAAVQKAYRPAGGERLARIGPAPVDVAAVKSGGAGAETSGRRLDRHE